MKMAFRKFPVILSPLRSGMKNRTKVDSIQKPKPQGSRLNGFTLVELLVAMAIFGAVLVTFVVIYISQSKTFKSEKAEADLQNEARPALEKISETTKGAVITVGPAAIPEAPSLGPDTDTLILRVPSINSNGAVLYQASGAILYFDHIIFDISGGNITQYVYPDPSGQSSRTQSQTAILKNVKAGSSFVYYPINPPSDWTQVTSVGINLTLQKTAGGKTVSVNISQTAKLRNK